MHLLRKKMRRMAIAALKGGGRGLTAFSLLFLFLWPSTCLRPKEGDERGRLPPRHSPSRKIGIVTTSTLPCEKEEDGRLLSASASPNPSLSLTQAKGQSPRPPKGQPKSRGNQFFCTNTLSRDELVRTNRRVKDEMQPIRNEMDNGCNGSETTA